MKYAAGVDVGSTQTKAVVINEEKEIVGRSLIDTGADVTKAAEDSYHMALQNMNIPDDDVGYVIGTGYGRYKVTFGDRQVTEISCHGRGAALMFPGTRTVLDMGGQDSKAISVQPSGEINDFCMNDKCAAGTGRFLGAAAKALELELSDLGPMALKSEKPVRISTTCTVFAEAEVLAWLGKGKTVEDILWGVHQSIAARTYGLLRRVGIEDEITFTGGVALNIGMIKAMEDRLETKMNVSDESHYMGALGAAMFALDAILAGETSKMMELA